jgi:micrococcal nuclease
MLAGLALASLACTPAEPDEAAPITSATVTRVVDGDTVVLAVGGTDERVRLIGVDAPESVAPNVPQQCFGAEAAAALGELLATGTEVRVVRDAEARDRYDRLLLYLYRSADDLFVNRWLVEAGFADAISYEPNVAHEAELNQAKATAVAGGIGLWGQCDGPDQPLD